MEPCDKRYNFAIKSVKKQNFKIVSKDGETEVGEPKCHSFILFELTPKEDDDDESE
jgi:hypothetical protein